MKTNWRELQLWVKVKGPQPISPVGSGSIPPSTVLTETCAPSDTHCSLPALHWEDPCLPLLFLLPSFTKIVQTHFQLLPQGTPFCCLKPEKLFSVFSYGTIYTFQIVFTAFCFLMRHFSSCLIFSARFEVLKGKDHNSSIGMLAQASPHFFLSVGAGKNIDSNLLSTGVV